jgi:hypothetical protein
LSRGLDSRRDLGGIARLDVDLNGARDEVGRRFGRLASIGDRTRVEGDEIAAHRQAETDRIRNENARPPDHKRSGEAAVQEVSCGMRVH